MRIGLFTDTYLPDINGVVSSVATLQEALTKLGHDVYVITNHKGTKTKLDGNVMRLPGLELKFLYGYKLSTPFQFNAREEIEKLNLDVIHVHTEFGVGMFGRTVAKLLRIPIISTYHTMYEDYTHYVNKFELSEVEKVAKKIVGSFSRYIGDTVQGVIAPSEKTKETLVSYGVNTPIYIVPTGLNFDKFSPDVIDQEKIEEVSKEMMRKDGETIAVFIGRIAPEKGIETVIRAFCNLVDEDIRLVVVGGGPQLEELKKLVITLNLEEKVMFTGPKPSDEIPAYYAAADCFVSASQSETQGMTYIEALACGLPVFAYPDPVVKDIVIHEVTGYLFEDQQKLADHLVTFSKLSKDARENMSEAARKIVKKYDSEVFASKIVAAYYQVIDDYDDAYEVTKVKTFDDYVKITVENDKEEQPLKIIVRMEDYFQHKIRVKSLFSRTTIDDLLEKEKQFLAYRACVRKLAIKDYTIFELKEYMRKTHELASDDINQVIEELNDRGYLDDERYAISYVVRSESSLYGKEKIVSNLKKKGIDEEIIDRAIERIDLADEREKANRVMNKMNLKDQSVVAARQKIHSKLVQEGFGSNLSSELSRSYGKDDDEELVALKSAVAKAVRQYQRRYEGDELQHKIYAYCMRKGFPSDKIKEVLSEMEW